MGSCGEGFGAAELGRADTGWWDGAIFAFGIIKGRGDGDGGFRSTDTFGSCKTVWLNSSLCVYKIYKYEIVWRVYLEISYFFW